MRKISPRVRDKLLEEPDVCALRSFGGCAGRITWEHCLTYGGKQIDEACLLSKKYYILQVGIYYHIYRRIARASITKPI